jgi:hypothetical protein
MRAKSIYTQHQPDGPMRFHQRCKIHGGARNLREVFLPWNFSLQHGEREHQTKPEGNGHDSDISGSGFIRQTKATLRACFSAISS